MDKFTDPLLGLADPRRRILWDMRSRQLPAWGEYCGNCGRDYNQHGADVGSARLAHIPENRRHLMCRPADWYMDKGELAAIC